MLREPAMQIESAAGDESRCLSRARGVLDAVRQDVRYATRLFVKAPVFTCAAVLALALGIGTSTAMFSIVNTLLLRPLPYVDADKLVRVVDNLPADTPGGARQVPSGFEGDEFLDLRDHSATLSYIGVYVGANTTLTGRGEPLPLAGQRMSADFFPMLGLSPVLGRVFTREEEVPGRDNVVVLSNRLWQRLFDGAPTALGQPVILDGQPYTVIGVMPARFDFPTADVDVWLPFRPAPVPGRSQRYYVYGRVAPSATMEAAAREVSQFLQERRGFSSVEEYIAAGELLPFGLVSLQSEILAPVRPAVILFAVAVGVVLLIACVDVGNLLLVHGAGRSREVGIRMALGAGRRRLFLQGLTESCTLAIFGGVLSIWVALASIRILRVLGTGLARRDLAAGVTIPRLAEVELDWRVLGFAVLVSLVTGIVCGTLPAWRYARAEPLHALRDEAAVRSAGTPLTRAFGAHALLVAGQVSLAIVLLICAGLLIRSFVNLSQIDPGYDDRSILTFQPSFPQGRYVGDRLSDFNEAVTAQIREMPGVRGVAYAYGLPMTQSRAGTRIRTSAAPPDPPRPLGSAPTAEIPTCVT